MTQPTTLPTAEQLQAIVSLLYSTGVTLAEAEAAFRKGFIVHALKENDFNQCKAARRLGFHRNTITRQITELKIEIKKLCPGHPIGLRNRRLLSRTGE